MNEQNTTYVVSVVEKPNSYEVGPAKARHKIYYKDAEDLKAQIDKLKTLGLWSEDELAKARDG